MVLVPWFESISFLSTDGRFPQIFIWQAMPNLPGQSMINHYSVYSSFGLFLMTKREASYIARKSGQEGQSAAVTVAAKR